MGTSGTPGQQCSQLISPFQQTVNGAAAKLAVRNPSLVEKGNQGTIVELVQSVYRWSIRSSYIHPANEISKTGMLLWGAVCVKIISFS